MTNTATGIVTNLPTTPGTTRKMLRKGQTVSIRLCVGGFADDGAREVLGTSYSYADVDGRWTATLEANAADGNQPGIVPAGTYYTVQELDGVIWAFKIVPGTSPVNLYDCLIDNPVAPPVPGGVSEAELTARLGTYVSIEPRVTTLSAISNTYTADADTTDVALVAAPVANFSVANPSGSPGDEQRLLIKVKSGATGYAPTWGNGFVSSGVATLPAGALPANKTVTFGFMYDATATKWVLLASDPTGY